MVSGTATKESHQRQERRRFVRLHLRGELNGGLLPHGEPLVILDLGLGGFAVEAPMPFVSGREYLFEFSSAGRRYRPLRAASVHCLRVTRAAGGKLYVAGFTFVATDDVDVATIESIVRDMQQVRSLVSGGVS
jgi:hypothetical protein